MSDRYSKLFALSEKPVFCGLPPVLIAAGALQKDNQTGKVFAQLKMRNLQGKSIKAATVNITPFDTVGNPLGEAVTYQYLDLSAGRDHDFGQKTPVMLQETATRSFAVSVSEVIFSDNSIWRASNDAWEPLSASRIDALNASRIAAEKGERKRTISIVIGVILAIIGAVSFIGGFRPNLASDGPTMRVLLIGGWTGLLTVCGLLLAITGAKNKETISKLPIIIGILAAICFVGFFLLTYL